MTILAEARLAMKDAFIESGIWRPALVKQTGKPAVTVYVGYEQPTERIWGNAVGTDQHTIRYAAADLPALREGDSVKLLDAAGAVIATKRFIVREAPYVPQNALDHSGDGYWKRALLTQV